jgi:hypothetical protein
MRRRSGNQARFQNRRWGAPVKLLGELDENRFPANVGVAMEPLRERRC